MELFHSHCVLTGFGVETEKNYQLAIEAAQRAVRLDPSDAEAQAVYAMSFGMANDLARAKTELDLALRMAPNQFEILTFYIGGASTFGEPERGAQLVDEAVPVQPQLSDVECQDVTSAYFMAGRYDDALRMLDRVEAENLGTWMWPIRAGALATLGRDAEAKAAVLEALKWYPNITIEGTTNAPGYSEAERKRVTETMRLAGFPACAKPEALAKIEKPLRLAGMPVATLRHYEQFDDGHLSRDYKTVEHTLFADVVDFDGEFVAIDGDDTAVTKSLVKDREDNVLFTQR